MPKILKLSDLSETEKPRMLITAQRVKKNFDVTTRSLRKCCTGYQLEEQQHHDCAGYIHRRFNLRWNPQEVEEKIRSGELKPENYEAIII